MAVLLTTAPAGARLPLRKATVLVRPRSAARAGRQDHVVGVDPIQLAQAGAQLRAALAVLPQVQGFIEGAALHGAGLQAQQAQVAQVQHHLGHAAGQEDLHGGIAGGAVGQHVHQARHGAVDRRPIFHHRAAQPGGMGDGRNVQQQIGAAAEGGVHHHGIVHGILGQNIGHGPAGGFHLHQGARRTARQVQPDGLAGRREGRMGHRQAQGFGDHLGGGGGAQKLAAAARRGAGPAGQLGGFFQADQAVGEARADRSGPCRHLRRLRAAGSRRRAR